MIYRLLLFVFVICCGRGIVMGCRSYLIGWCNWCWSWWCINFFVLWCCFLCCKDVSFCRRCVYWWWLVILNKWLLVMISCLKVICWRVNWWLNIGWLWWNCLFVVMKWLISYRKLMLLVWVIMFCKMCWCNCCLLVGGVMRDLWC